METKPFLVNYILVYTIAVCDWEDYTYEQKKQFHYLVMVSGKVIVTRPLVANDGTIEVAYIDSEPYAKRSNALFGLLLDLWILHNEAKIIYAKDLQIPASSQVVINASRWLVQHAPVWLQRRLPKCNNLFTLRSLIPLI